MDKYSCKKCGKEYTREERYIKHINKKNQCIAREVEKIKFIDLFCGIGSFHYSFKKLNWECVMSCDIDDAARETYNENYGLMPLGDITEINPKDVPAYDILCAGFPCFVMGTQTLTNNGYKNIEDVEITDKLLTHAGMFQKIINLQKKLYNRTLFEIDINCHPKLIITTEEHPFYIREKKEENMFDSPQWKKANELTMNDHFGMIINVNEIIPEFVVLEDCFALGCNYRQYNIDIIPEWIHDAPKVYIREFINGYINDNKIVATSLNMAYCLQRLLLKLGRIVSINKICENEYHMPEANKLAFIENNYAWYAPFKIASKNSAGISVYNFEVENDNSYIVENTVVHNCQPFSQCGHHKGFGDKRGTLFFNIMKFVECHRPKIIVLENVQGLLNHDKGKTFERIKCDIETANYTIAYKVIKCSDYGLPQMRKRLIIIGVRNDTVIVKYIDKLFDFDEYKKQKTLSELLGKNFEKKTAYTIRCGGKNSPINDKHNWDGYMVDGKEYRLTKEDCLKIQGFNPDFKLCGSNRNQWKQLGNTIPTIFTEIIGLNINKFILL